MLSRWPQVDRLWEFFKVANVCMVRRDGYKERNAFTGVERITMLYVVQDIISRKRLAFRSHTNLKAQNLI